MLPRKITAADFIEHTAPAVRALFDTVAAERGRYEPKQSALLRAHNMHYADFASSDLQEDFDDHQVQHKFVRAAEAKMQAILVSQSVDVLCGAILQIGKQGISLILTGDARYSKGRSVGSQCISAIVWHGRNQAMHWEDGRPDPGHKHTINCFGALEEEFGSQFSFDGSPRNMAKDIISVMGWTTYQDYEKDIRDILGG